MLVHRHLLPPDVRRTYCALEEQSEVALTRSINAQNGRRLKEEENQSQQYLTPSEEKAVVKFLLHMSNIGQPARIKYMFSLVFGVARYEALIDRPMKRPGRESEDSQDASPESIRSRTGLKNRKSVARSSYPC